MGRASDTTVVIMRLVMTRREGDLASQVARVETCEEQLARMGDDAGTLVRELGRLRETADALSRVCAERGTRLADREARATWLESQHAESDRRREQAVSALRDADARVRLSAEQAAAAERELATFREQFDERDRRVREHQSDAEALRHELARREDNLVQFDAKLGELTRQREAAEAAAAAAARHLTEIRAEADILRDKLASQHVTLEQARAAAVDAARDATASQRRAASILLELAGDRDELVRPEAAMLKPLSTAVPTEAAECDVPTGHVRLLALGDGYTLTSSDGVGPRAGDRVELDGRHFLVAGAGSSPLPGDRRRCVVLLPLPH